MVGTGECIVGTLINILTIVSISRKEVPAITGTGEGTDIVVTVVIRPTDTINTSEIAGGIAFINVNAFRFVFRKS